MTREFKIAWRVTKTKRRPAPDSRGAGWFQSSKRTVSSFTSFRGGYLALPERAKKVTERSPKKWSETVASSQKQQSFQDFTLLFTSGSRKCSPRISRARCLIFQARERKGQSDEASTLRGRGEQLARLPREHSRKVDYRGLPLSPRRDLRRTDKRPVSAYNSNRSSCSQSSGRLPCPCTTTSATIVTKPSN
jgi:hypothetical protein